MVNVVARNPFGLSKHQILAFGRLATVNDSHRLEAARLVGDLIGEGLSPLVAIARVASERPHMFRRNPQGPAWSEDNGPDAPTAVR